MAEPLDYQTPTPARPLRERVGPPLGLAVMIGIVMLIALFVLVGILLAASGTFP